MKHILIILISIHLLSSPVNGQSDDKCYVVVDSSENINPSLLLKVSISLISKFVRDVEDIPVMGITMDSCHYQVAGIKNNETTFITFKGEGLNSYGDSKLPGSDGFQQSIIKSLYRSLRDKRNIICKDYGTLLDECNKAAKKETGVMFGIQKKSKWGGFKMEWYDDDDDDRHSRYIGEIENGLPNGKGVEKAWTPDYRGKEGWTTYEGEWKDGKRHGYGTLNQPGPYVHEGNYIDGQRTGQGKITFPDGATYLGEFKDGKQNGHAIYTFSDGYKFIGVFKNDRPWNGKEYDPDRKLSVNFKNGKAL